MFKNLQLIPKDPILDLVREFNNDPRTDKVNLTVGIYANDQGLPVLFDSVRKAEQAIIEENLGKNYLPIKGTSGFLNNIAHHALGNASDLFVACYGSGGTGALRLAAEVMKMSYINAQPTIWINTPTWEIHNVLFKHCGFQIINYPWLTQDNELAFNSFIDELEKNGHENDWVLLHGCCHNPTGIDPAYSQWLSLFELMKKKNMKPLFDIAYHGFGKNLEEDIAHIQTAIKMFDEIVICYSLSKAMGLYNDRCGALFIKCDMAQKDILDSNVERMARLLFSNPPAFGVRIVEKVISDPILYKGWVEELSIHRKRLENVRQEFAKALHTTDGRFDYIGRAKGMFSLTGLNLPQIEKLKRDHGIYLVKNSRINIAGINNKNINKVVDAIKNVL